MGFSRAFTGAHAWDQIIFGWTLGIWVGAFIHFNRDAINNWVDRMQDKEQFVKQLFYAVLSLVVVFGIQIGTYYVMSNLSEGPGDEILANIQQQCGDKETINKMTFFNHGLKKTGESVVFCAVYFGLILSAKMGLNDEKRSASPLRYTGAIILLVALCAPWYWMWEVMEKPENVWVCLVVKYQVPLFFGPLSVLLLFNYICTILHLNEPRQVQEAPQNSNDNDYRL